MIPRRILFCTDFSENSRPALQCALDYAKAFGADLAVLHVINSVQIGYPSLAEPVPVDIKSVLDTIQESVDKGLELVAADCRHVLADVTTHTRIGTPAFEIGAFADENSIDLIVMGTHGWTGLKHIIMGSTAENVVRTANCPVLTVKPSRPSPKKG
jgi:nucleotide-binding universal stress UspA family protein